MSLNDIEETLQNTIGQSEDNLKDELYTVTELSKMFKISRQHMGKLIKDHNIEVINFSSSGVKRRTIRIQKSEVLRLKEILIP